MTNTLINAAAALFRPQPPRAVYKTRNLSLRLPKGANPARYLLDLTRPVRVYRNLTRDCYSIQQGGIVKAHADSVVLEDVAWTVSQPGRRRVIRDGKKNVHAFAVGYLVPTTTAAYAAPVRYNPYKMDSFRADQYNARLTKSDGAYLNAHSQSFALWSPEVEK
tara:strand:- start:971 stop:1459 length:489 start_codon:yes stop_codon:yes gene_type:complete